MGVPPASISATARLGVMNQPTTMQENSAHTGMSTVLVTSSKNVSQSSPNSAGLDSSRMATWPSEMPIGIDTRKQTPATMSAARLRWAWNFWMTNCVTTSISDTTEVMAAISTMTKKANDTT